MGSVLILIHVIAAILFLGPVTVATSLFPREALAVHNGNTKARGAVRILHRISNDYGTISLLVPLLGFAIMFTGDYWSNGKFHASIALSIVAWALLIFAILPRQRKMVAALGISDEDPEEPASEITDWKKAKGQLAMFSGIFAASWVVIAILMLI